MYIDIITKVQGIVITALMTYEVIVYYLFRAVIVMKTAPIDSIISIG